MTREYIVHTLPYMTIGIKLFQRAFPRILRVLEDGRIYITRRGVVIAVVSLPKKKEPK